MHGFKLLSIGVALAVAIASTAALAQYELHERIATPLGVRQ